MNLDKIGDWCRTHYSVDVNPDMDGQEITLFGWVQEIRDLGALHFVILQDREGTVQVTVAKNKTPSEVISKVAELHKRFSAGVKGVVRKTRMTARGIEVIPKEVRIFSAAQAELPIDITGKTPASLEIRLDARALDLCSAENVAVFEIQHTAIEAIRDFLFELGFLEVHTPRFIGSATEGGAALFEVNYFGSKAYLAQSPQLYKEQLVMSLEKVFEVGPFFRAEESQTRRHLSEFVSIDVEQAFVDAGNVMQLLEQLIHHVCRMTKKKCARELAVLKHNLEVPELPFERMSYDRALTELKSEDVEIPWGEDIPTPALRILGRKHRNCYFITDWPTASKAFYIKPRDDKPEVSEGFDLMWGHIELVSGGTRINDKQVLIERLKEKGLNPESFKFHLQTFDYGMPPHAGWAIGMERLTMVLTGKRNIREVTLYPRDRMRLTP